MDKVSVFGKKQNECDDADRAEDIGPTTCKRRAEDYYEYSVNLKFVAAIFSQEPLTEFAILALNPHTDTEFGFAEASAIGYPQNQ